MTLFRPLLFSLLVPTATLADGLPQVAIPFENQAGYKLAMADRIGQRPGVMDCDRVTAAAAAEFADQILPIQQQMWRRALGVGLLRPNHEGTGLVRLSTDRC